MLTTISHEQLNSLNTSYANCIDEDRLESWPDFFTEDCFYKITTIENFQQELPAGLMYADSRGMLRDRVSALREANVFEHHRYRHIVGLPVITGTDADGLNVKISFMVARIMRGGKTELFATGQYVDRVVLNHTREAILASRIVVCDSTSFDTLLAIPL